jgi:hypothetical protein
MTNWHGQEPPMGPDADLRLYENLRDLPMGGAERPTSVGDYLRYHDGSFEPGMTNDGFVFDDLLDRRLRDAITNDALLSPVHAELPDVAAAEPSPVGPHTEEAIVVIFRENPALFAEAMDFLKRPVTEDPVEENESSESDNAEKVTARLQWVDKLLSAWKLGEDPAEGQLEAIERGLYAVQRWLRGQKGSAGELAVREFNKRDYRFELRRFGSPTQRGYTSELTDDGGIIIQGRRTVLYSDGTVAPLR